MRVTVIVTVMLVACCLTVDATWWGRRRRSSSSNGNSNQFGVNVNGNNDNPILTGTWTHTGDNWDGSVSGSVDTQGNWLIGGTIKFRKRDLNYYNITLVVDPCNFKSYDDDRNGEITEDEFHAVFGSNDKVDALFKDLDFPIDDGKIEVREFYDMAPVTISACFDMDE